MLGNDEPSGRSTRSSLLWGLLWCFIGSACVPLAPIAANVLVAFGMVVATWERGVKEQVLVLCVSLAAGCSVSYALFGAFDIPSSRAFMHLDTVFTQIDRDRFTIHPGILGPLRVFELRPDGKGGVTTTERDTRLEDILSEYVGCPVELLLCGAGNKIAAEREQWNDGSNTLCVEPGKIVVYQRNDVTNAYLDSKGLDLVVVPSAELSRGRGGPRCMSMPVWREDL